MYAKAGPSFPRGMAPVPRDFYYLGDDFQLLARAGNASDGDPLKKKKAEFLRHEIKMR